VNLTSVHVAQRSMPKDFMDSHVKVAVADPLNTIASTTWCGNGLSVAHIPATKEPSALLRSDGKRPDRLTLIPWKNGRCVTWDVTITDTLAQFYMPATSGLSGVAAEEATERKMAKCGQLAQSYTFIPVVIETLVPINNAGLKFLSNLRTCISQVYNDHQDSAFLFQRLSVLIQWFNAVAIQGTFAHTPAEDEI